MSFLYQGRLAADESLMLRVTACAASVGVEDPKLWAQERVWQLVAQDGWAKAYADSTDDAPGADENAITDQMIRAAVQAIRTAETPPAE